MFRAGPARWKSRTGQHDQEEPGEAATQPCDRAGPTRTPVPQHRQHQLGNTPADAARQPRELRCIWREGARGFHGVRGGPGRARNALAGPEMGARHAERRRDPKPRVGEKQESCAALPCSGHPFPGTPAVQGRADTAGWQMGCRLRPGPLVNLARIFAPTFPGMDGGACWGWAPRCPGRLWGRGSVARP